MGGLRAAGRRPRGGVQEARDNAGVSMGPQGGEEARVQQLCRWRTLAHSEPVTYWVWQWGGEDRPGSWPWALVGDRH